MMTKRSWLFVLALAIQPIATNATPASAQTIRGVVTDDVSRTLLADATLTLLDANGAPTRKASVRSDSLGRFVLHAGETGRYRVRATRLGYSPLTSANIDLSLGGAVADLVLRLSATETRLGAVVVNATTRLSRDELMSHVGFELRRAKGQGKFLDTTELARYDRDPAAAVLEERGREFGLEVSQDRNTGKATFGMPITGKNVCQPEVWIDGFEVLPAWRAVERMHSLGADLIFGIEVFGPRIRPPASIAAELGNGAAGGSLQKPSIAQGNRYASAPWQFMPDLKCGIVAIWTRAFVAEMKTKQAARSGG